MDSGRFNSKGALRFGAEQLFPSRNRRAVSTGGSNEAATSLHEGLLIANENLYTKLTLGVTVIEFVDGKKHPDHPNHRLGRSIGQSLHCDRRIRTAVLRLLYLPASSRVLSQRVARRRNRGQAAQFRQP
jgi:hypothetical protein